MKTITVKKGKIVNIEGGRTQDRTEEVKFVGEELATYSIGGIDERTGKTTGVRGEIRKLYRREDGQLLVHIKDWEPEFTIYTLEEIDKADLRADGRFHNLGLEAGLAL